MPAATGFMTAVRKPRATSARVSATVDQRLADAGVGARDEKALFSRAGSSRSVRAGESRRAR